jgi:hypothetical protein
MHIAAYSLKLSTLPMRINNQKVNERSISYKFLSP